MMHTPPDTGSPQPQGEQIHLPEPSFLPATCAAGVTVTLLGLITNWVVLAIGLVVVVLTVSRWIADVRRDISHLPE